jgi:hypothetical protein
MCRLSLTQKREGFRYFAASRANVPSAHDTVRRARGNAIAIPATYLEVVAVKR